MKFSPCTRVVSCKYDYPSVQFFRSSENNCFGSIKSFLFARIWFPVAFYGAFMSNHIPQLAFPIRIFMFAPSSNKVIR